MEAAKGASGVSVYPCPVHDGMAQRWRIARERFEPATVQHDNDAAILRWAQQTITHGGIDAANSWLVVEQ